MNDRIPFDPMAAHLHWFNMWRSRVRNAKQCADPNNGYCYAAQIAQAIYVTLAALAVMESKR